MDDIPDTWGDRLFDSVGRITLVLAWVMTAFVVFSAIWFNLKYETVRASPLLGWISPYSRVIYTIIGPAFGAAIILSIIAGGFRRKWWWVPLAVVLVGSVLTPTIDWAY